MISIYDYSVHVNPYDHSLRMIPTIQGLVITDRLKSGEKITSDQKLKN